jgi:hypothetical protein
MLCAGSSLFSAFSLVCWKSEVAHDCTQSFLPAGTVVAGLKVAWHFHCFCRPQGMRKPGQTHAGRHSERRPVI